MALKAIGRAIDRVVSTISAALAYVSAAMVIGMALVMFCDTILRYFFNSPIRGAQELVELAMCIFVYTGISLSIRKRGAITVPLIVERLSPLGRRIVNGLSNTLCSAMCAALSYRLFLTAIKELNRVGVGTSILKIPFGPFYLTAAICCVVITLENVILAVKDFAGISDAPKGPNNEKEEQEK